MNETQSAKRAEIIEQEAKRKELDAIKSKWERKPLYGSESEYLHALHLTSASVFGLLATWERARRLRGSFRDSKELSSL